MYFNNIQILNYVFIGIIGLIVGKFTCWCNIRIPEKKKIFSKDFFEANKEGMPGNYLFMIVTSMVYIALLYKLGFDKEHLAKNLDLIRFLLLVPMLLLTFSIDIKHRIIPNRLNLTIFETGLVLSFVYGVTNVNMAKDYILGMFTGVIIFVAITILGWIASGKESMGLGDIKFMGAIGLFYGMSGIAEVSVLAFVLAAIICVFVIIIRLILKKKVDYVPFGPFLATSALICMFIPAGCVFNAFLEFCKILSQTILG